MMLLLNNLINLNNYYLPAVNSHSQKPKPQGKTVDSNKRRK